MIYKVNLRGFKPFATANKREALNMLNYLRSNGFKATLSSETASKYIQTTINRIESAKCGRA